MNHLKRVVWLGIDKAGEEKQNGKIVGTYYIVMAGGTSKTEVCTTEESAPGQLHAPQIELTAVSLHGQNPTCDYSSYGKVRCKVVSVLHGGLLSPRC
jgi:hypothetical protein